MKLPVTYILIFFCLIQSVTLNMNIKEVCDIEGSGAEDCPIDTYCCKQSECHFIYDNEHDTYIDIEYDSDDGRSNKKCCNELERNQYPTPSNCKVCTRCCDEIERTKTPLPPHCSKCRTCEYSATVTTSKYYG